MLNTHEATVGEADVIIKKLKERQITSLEYSYDDEDDIGFVSGVVKGSFLKPDVVISFQDRGAPMFFSFRIKNDRYDIHYPKGELLTLLTGIASRAKEEKQIGRTLQEKLNGRK